MEKKSRNKKIKQLKRLRGSIKLLLLSGTLAFFGCNCNNQDKTFKATLEEQQDNTLLDEYLTKNNPILLEEVQQLEEYIELSNELEKNKFEKISITEEELKGQELMSIYEINELKYKYLDNKKDKELLFKLNIQRKLINTYILNNGYKISSDIILLTLKTKIAESYGLTPELTIQWIDKITIPDRTSKIPDDISFKIGSKHIKLENDLNKLLNNIYTLQYCNERKETGIKDYKEDRNDLIMDSLNHAEKKLSKQYTVKFKK